MAMIRGVGALLGAHPFLLGWLLVAVACGLDRLIGDPRWSPHPVVVMGWWISRLRTLAERWAGDQPRQLRLAGGVITLLLVGGSGLAGWGLERLARCPGTWGAVGMGLLLLALASALAGRSLAEAVRAVVAELPAPGTPGSPMADLEPARQRLAWIVGRDTTELNAPEILRAAAETASENAVDGLFAPLFWMLLGTALWGLADGLPGPLSLVWGFKAASTLDSMLGYRRGRLRWLGTAGARLDDLLVWLPCRLVVLSLPLVQGEPRRWWQQVRASFRDGQPDPSPNAGVSQAAYAHAAGVQLGGRNRYAEGWKDKPLLAAGQPPADAAAVERILALSRRLSLLWLLLAGAWAIGMA
jgi:adenosylcobinamide-phosphate synthase